MGEIGRAPGVDRERPHTRRSSGSSQVAPRHPKAVAYRCFLPDLTGFTDLRCVGPDFQRRAISWEAEARRPRPGIQPRCSGLRVQGTASSPPSTASAIVGPCRTSVNRGLAERGIRTPDGFPRTAFPVRRHRPLGDLSADATMWGGPVWEWRRGWDSNPRCSSHTAFRERHLKPLGHLSAAESSRGWTDPRPSGRALRRWPAPRLPAEPPPRARRRPRTAGAAGPCCGPARRRCRPLPLLVRHRVDQGEDLCLDQRADAHGARLMGGEDRDFVEPARLELAGGGLQRQQHGVGGGVALQQVRSWSRAIMASSRTATAPTGTSPSSPPRRASAMASAMKSS